MASKFWTGATDGSWATAGNWTPSAPANGDDVYVQNSSVSITSGLNQSALTLNSLNVDMSFTGAIGDASTYLQIGLQGSKVVNLGQPASSGTGGGSGRVKLNFGSTTTVVVNVANTSGSASDTNLPPVQLLGSGISALNVTGGSVGVAVGKNETATVTTLSVNRNGGTDAQVSLGDGATVTTVKCSGGTVTNRSTAATTTVTLNGGTVNNYGTGALTTVNVAKGATFAQIGNGTITTLTLFGKADFSKDPRAKTVTNCTMYEGAEFSADTGVTKSVTVTNGIVLSGADLSDVVIRMGDGFTVTVS